MQSNNQISKQANNKMSNQTKKIMLNQNEFIKHLSELKGIGEKNAIQIIEYFGSEQKALDAINNLRFDRLQEISTISNQLNQEIVKQVIARKYNFNYSEVFKTKEGRQIFNTILSQLKSKAVTEFGKLMLSAFYPTTDSAEIKRRQTYVEQARQFTGSIKQIEKVQQMLQHLTDDTEVSAKIFDNITIVTEDYKIAANIKQQTKNKVSVITIASEHELESLEDYSAVRYIRTDESKFFRIVENMDNAIIFDEDDKIEEIVPELTLCYFIERKRQIKTVMEIIELMNDGCSLQSQCMIKRIFGQNFNVEKFKEIVKLTENLEETSITFSAHPDNEKFKKIENIESRLTEIIVEKIEQANTELKESIANTKLEGTQLLEVIGKGKLPENISQLIANRAKQCLEEIERTIDTNTLKIPPHAITGLIKDTTQFPLSADEKEIENLRKQLQSTKDTLSLNIKKDLIALLKDKRTKIDKAIFDAMNLDIIFGLSRFAEELQLRNPIVSSNGFIIQKAKNIELAQKHNIESIQPVSYHLGREHSMSIITGANSGGKTSLLNLIMQTHIMALMGLPVCAEKAELSIVEELYYFKKSNGDKDAGAFETMLRMFASITQASDKRRLILADEIEAITEPGAAAKIICALLKWFEKDKNTLFVLVSHLGEDIKTHLSANVRIDGIQAKGLDDKLNLIIDRNPIINCIARSTPELIVQRLSKTETETNKSDFFRHLRSAMT